MQFCTPVYSDFLTSVQRDFILKNTQKQCHHQGFEICEDSENSAFFILTGGTERLVQDAVSQLPTSQKITILAHANNNSLPAALEILARLNMDGRCGRIVYLDAEAIDLPVQAPPQPITPTSLIAGARIGVVGAPSDWLIASSPQAAAVRTSWGCELIDIPLDELYEGISNNASNTQNPLAQRFAGCIIEPSTQDLMDAEVVYLALAAIVKKYHLDAVTVRCFDLLLTRKMTGCYALARLNDEGIPAGCEGDISAIVALLWRFRKTGIMPWMANPSRLDVAKNQLVVAHCTLPLSMATSINVRSHFESGLGVAFDGEIPPQKICIGRLGGAALERQWWARGEIVEALHETSLCRTQVCIQLNAPHHVNDLLHEPLGNHLIIQPATKV